MAAASLEAMTSADSGGSAARWYRCWLAERVSWSIVPFPIDVSKPFRYPSELKRLVEAVRAAGDYDETRWIEWKRTLDLTSAESTRHIARQILGFANRDPQVAAQWAGGYAYLVIGTSPEGSVGITPIDPEQLVSKIRPYVGSHITWTPEYVEVDGTRVLVIIVEPPRPGDEIHALRKQLDSYKSGTVLVRRHGQIDQADADELAMLQRRLLARTPEVELSIEPVAPTIEALPDFQGLIETWAAEEHVRRVTARYQPEPSKEPAANRSLLGAAFAAAVSRDLRSIEQYEAEIDSYLAEVKQALLERGIWHLARHLPAKLAMQVRNSNARNYAQVGVILAIKSTMVRGYERGTLDLIDKDKPRRLPKPPAPLGTPSGGAASSWGVGLIPQIIPGPKLSGLPSLPVLRRGWQASNNDEGVNIEFDPCDLRPYEVIQLPTVPLVVKTLPGTVISVEWAATATNADGKVTGRCAMSVSESTLGDGWMT